MDIELLIDTLAYTLHCSCWYNNSIEGRLVRKDGINHGRFRPSKNLKLDRDFINSIKFESNGNSVLKTTEGYPYYRMVNGTFMVDTALNGFDFLPPSWKEESYKTAEVVLYNIEVCINNNLSISKYINVISAEIHNRWIARQVSSALNISEEEAYKAGTLTKEEIMNAECGKSQLIQLFNSAGKEIKNVYGWNNFLEFKELPFEEKMKDTYQILYALDLLVTETNILAKRARDNNYDLHKEYKETKRQINLIDKTKNYYSYEEFER